MATNRWRCSFCRTPDQPWGFEFESAIPQCPNCHAQGLAVVIPLVNVHLYAPDVNGKIMGAGGRRYRIACSPEKTNPNGVPCTGMASAVTCQRCKETDAFELAARLQREFAGAILVE